jgi:hypothetical protein
MPRFAPEGAKKERAERLAREAKEAKRTMASQQARRHQTAESYQDEGTNTLLTTPMIDSQHDSHDFVMYYDI